MDHTIKTRLLLRPVRSALGTIRIGGFNKQGVGVGIEDAPPRTLSCYGFNLIVQGDGFYADAQERREAVKAGDVVLFFPKKAHRCFAHTGETWDELWFEFEGPVFDLMHRNGVLDSRHPIRVTASGVPWLRRFMDIMPPLHLRRKISPEVVVMRFAATLVELLDGSSLPVEGSIATRDAEPEDWVNRACAWLTNPGGEVVSASQIARRLGFSYENFRKKFRTATGFSPGQFQVETRMDRAASLLYEGSHSIKEIASALGFCDEFYFSRSFKRRFGQSPSQFRKAAHRRVL